MPILIHWVGIRLHILIYCQLGSQSESTSPESSAKSSRQPIRIEYYVTRVVSQSKSSTLGSRQPIRIEYYVTRVVITSTESSRLGWRSRLGSTRLAIAYLDTWGTSTPLQPQPTLLLLFHLFVPSILCVFLEVLLKLFDYFWKPNSPFSKLCVNCLLRFHFVYCNNWVLNHVWGACWCICSLVALHVPNMYFWPAETRKKLEVFEMHTCLWPDAQIWFRHKWRKLVTASLLVHCIDGYSKLRCWNDFFQLDFRF